MQCRVLLAIPVTHAKYYTALKLTCLLQSRDSWQLKSCNMSRSSDVVLINLRQNLIIYVKKN